MKQKLEHDDYKSDEDHKQPFPLQPVQLIVDSSLEIPEETIQIKPIDFKLPELNLSFLKGISPFTKLLDDSVLGQLSILTLNSYINGTFENSNVIAEIIVNGEIYIRTEEAWLHVPFAKDKSKIYELVSLGCNQPEEKDFGAIIAVLEDETTKDVTLRLGYADKNQELVAIIEAINLNQNIKECRLALINEDTSNLNWVNIAFEIFQNSSIESFKLEAGVTRKQEAEALTILLEMNIALKVMEFPKDSVSKAAKIEILYAWMHSTHLQGVKGLGIEPEKALEFLKHILNTAICPKDTKTGGITNITAKKILGLTGSYELYDKNITELISKCLEKENALDFLQNFILNRNTVYPDIIELQEDVSHIGDIKEGEC